MSRERFPEHVEVAAYFVASEALANATKHSQASRIDVALTAKQTGSCCRYATTVSAAPTRTRNGHGRTPRSRRGTQRHARDHEHPCSRHFARRDAANPRRNRCRRWPCRVKSPFARRRSCAGRSQQAGVSKRPGRWVSAPRAIAIMALEHKPTSAHPVRRLNTLGLRSTSPSRGMARLFDRRLELSVAPQSNQRLPAS